MGADIKMWTKEEQKSIPPQYGCELIHFDADENIIKDPLLPSDAYNIFYLYKDKMRVDVCRGSRVRIFDMYYDKFGPESIKKIDWGYGKFNPKMWGYKPLEKNKKR
jgi:hypothetical protein